MPCTVPYSYSPSATAAAHRETTISIAKAQLRIFFIRFSSQFLFPNPFGRISAKRAVRMRLVGFAFTILSGRASHGFAADCYQYSIEYTLRCFVIIIRLVGRFVNRVNIIFFSRLSKMQNGNVRVRKRGNIHFCSRWAGVNSVRIPAWRGVSEGGEDLHFRADRRSSWCNPLAKRRFSRKMRYWLQGIEGFASKQQKTHRIWWV